jgi:hypothetical protein
MFGLYVSDATKEQLRQFIDGFVTFVLSIRSHEAWRVARVAAACVTVDALSSISPAASPPPVRDPHIGNRDHLATGQDLLGLRVALLFRHFWFWTGALGGIAMIDTDTILAATVAPSSTFDRPAALGRDRDADDLDRLAASLHWLAYYCCGKPFVD